MTTFLSWVYAQAGKVYDWFGNTYYTLKNAAANAWNWAVEHARNAYYDAIDWAYARIEQIKIIFNSSLSLLQQFITNVRNGLVEDFIAFIDWVEWKFTTLGDFASSVVNNAIYAVYGFIDTVRNGILAIVNGLIEWVWSRINDAYGWIISLRDHLMNIVILLTPDRIQAVLSFLTTGLTAITEFFRNPVLFILDVIQEHVLGFLGYVIAWAMGTTKHELPKSPPWRK